MNDATPYQEQAMTDLSSLKTKLVQAPDAKQQELLALLQAEGGAMDCEDTRLDPYSDDRGRDENDTFNKCRFAGWIKTRTYFDDSAAVLLTDAGRQALTALTTQGERNVG